MIYGRREKPVYLVVHILDRDQEQNMQVCLELLYCKGKPDNGGRKYSRSKAPGRHAVSSHYVAHQVAYTSDVDIDTI